jgi:DNA modification methylase
MTLDNSWSFEELTPSQTSYITHSYHRYPAKFIPQLAARVILENSLPGDLVCDPFMGSATTLVEAIVHDRKAYGTDINPVAALIARAKTTPIAPLLLKKEVEEKAAYKLPREAFRDKNTGSPTYRLLVSRETKTPPSDHTFKD